MPPDMPRSRLCAAISGTPWRASTEPAQTTGLFGVRARRLSRDRPHRLRGVLSMRALLARVERSEARARAIQHVSSSLQPPAPEPVRLEQRLLLG
jgi:hypothetical protein